MYTVAELLEMAEMAGLTKLLRRMQANPKYAAQVVAVINAELAEDEEPAVPQAAALTPDQMARVTALMRDEQAKLVARIKASRRAEIVGASA